MEKFQTSDIPKSPRIQKLVDALYEHMPVIESARAKLITESYKETEGEPIITRRAKAFAHILHNIPIIIRDNELIVGSSTIAPRGCQTFPEFSYEWLEAELDTVATRTADPFEIAEETKAELKEADKYWKGKTTSELATSYMAPEAIKAIEHNIFTPGNYFYNGVGHVTVKYWEVLETGFEGIMEKAQKELDGCSVGDGNYARKSHFLEAVILSCKAVIDYAGRYAKLAQEMAAQTSDPVRNRNFLLSQRTAAGYRQRVHRISMRHVSHSGLYSSFFRWNPVDILFHRGALISICIHIIRRIWKQELLPESSHRN